MVLALLILVKCLHFQSLQCACEPRYTFCWRRHNTRSLVNFSPITVLISCLSWLDHRVISFSGCYSRRGFISDHKSTLQWLFCLDQQWWVRAWRWCESFPNAKLFIFQCSFVALVQELLDELFTKNFDQTLLFSLMISLFVRNLILTVKWVVWMLRQLTTFWKITSSHWLNAFFLV